MFKPEPISDLEQRILEYFVLIPGCATGVGLGIWGFAHWMPLWLAVIIGVPTGFLAGFMLGSIYVVVFGLPYLILRHAYHIICRIFKDESTQ